MPRPVANPPNPWHTTHVEWLGEPPAAKLEVFEEEARSMLSKNDSPDVPFRYGVNPYRGCFHGCAYCYARRSHQYLDWGAGTDFERKLVVKTNAEAALRRDLARRSWKRETLVFSGNTDCYQPLEASYGLTRACLEACLEFRNPVGVITKSALVARDAELLARLERAAGATVVLSIPFADADMARAIEPYAPAPERRFAALRALHEAGVPVRVAVAPVIPGLNEAQIPEVLERAVAAGARGAFMILLRLPQEVDAVFRERLAEAYPDRAKKVLAALEDMRSAQTSRSAFGQRMRGAGPRWQAVEDLFRLHCRRLGLDVQPMEFPEEAPRPRAAAQGELF
ncbi:MAG: PA0069 family radical SAM protein [Planctomycetes bacterium]|nr:PA0069 family radical SAM protein [Planctomycetota bacterium]